VAQISTTPAENDRSRRRKNGVDKMNVSGGWGDSAEQVMAHGMPFIKCVLSAIVGAACMMPTVPRSDFIHALLQSLRPAGRVEDSRRR
jgi:hypothetical protein